MQIKGKQVTIYHATGKEALEGICHLLDTDWEDVAGWIIDDHANRNLNLSGVDVYAGKEEAIKTYAQSRMGIIRGKCYTMTWNVFVPFVALSYAKRR